MEWEQTVSGYVAEGSYWAYLITTDGDGPGAVILTRVARGHLGLVGHLPLPVLAAVNAARHAARFPVGRGPGRPGGQPEVDALVEVSKGYAEAYERDGHVPDLPGWTGQSEYLRRQAQLNGSVLRGWPR